MQVGETRVTMHEIAVHWDGHPQPPDSRPVRVECPDDYNLAMLTAADICEDPRVMILRDDDVRLMDCHDAAMRILTAVESGTLVHDEDGWYDRDPALIDLDGVVRLDAQGRYMLQVPDLRERAGFTWHLIPADDGSDDTQYDGIDVLVAALAGDPIVSEDVMALLGYMEWPRSDADRRPSPALEPSAAIGWILGVMDRRR